MMLMLKIDVHTHILPKDIPKWKDKFGYGGFITLDHYQPCSAHMVRDDGKQFRDIEENCWEPAKTHRGNGRTRRWRSSAFDRAGNVQLLDKAAGRIRDREYLNDHIADVVTEFPLRFVGLGTIPMQDTKLAITELERCKQIGLEGVEIGTNINQLNLGESQFFDFFKACEELGMACSSTSGK
jgi:aminocarboxymuconate-semialdehyde decarboxylase